MKFNLTWSVLESNRANAKSCRLAAFACVSFTSSEKKEISTTFFVRTFFLLVLLFTTARAHSFPRRLGWAGSSLLSYQWIYTTQRVWARECDNTNAYIIMSDIFPLFLLFSSIFPSLNIRRENKWNPKLPRACSLFLFLEHVHFSGFVHFLFVELSFELNSKACFLPLEKLQIVIKCNVRYAKLFTTFPAVTLITFLETLHIFGKIYRLSR